MGNGIAQVSALAGFKTLLFDLNEEVLHKSKSSIEKSLIALVSKGKIAGQERDETIARLTFTNNIAQCIADVFIEAIVEDLEAKISLFSQLQTININRSLFLQPTHHPCQLLKFQRVFTILQGLLVCISSTRQQS